MNIFVLSRNVRTCAQLHCDQHVVKMPLETAQLLSTALALTAPQAWAELQAAGLAYKPTHQQHPCALWARECINNYLWLARLGLELGAEYSLRYTPEGESPRAHKSVAVLRALRAAAPPLPDKRVITPFPLVMPAEYQQPLDPVGSYRRYYAAAKGEFARYTRRPRPEWMPAGPGALGRG
jgi:hypothetical protein